MYQHLRVAHIQPDISNFHTVPNFKALSVVVAYNEEINTTTSDNQQSNLTLTGISPFRLVGHSMGN